MRGAPGGSVIYDFKFDAAAAGVRGGEGGDEGGSIHPSPGWATSRRSHPLNDPRASE